MSGVDKASILANVASSPVTKRQVLRELGVRRAPTTGGSSSRDWMIGQEAIQRRGTASRRRSSELS